MANQLQKDKLLLVYMSNTIKLIRSMVLYSKGAHALIGDTYISHLQGIATPEDDDIIALSSDTGESFIFNKDTIIQHPRTLLELRNGETVFKHLVDKYPDRTELIRGILFPVPEEMLQDVYDGKVLTYDDNLVEHNEITLIHTLQESIKRYKLRWDNEHYIYSNKYYLIYHLSIMISHMVPELLRIRLDRIHTHEVHSFHVYAHLASNHVSFELTEALSFPQRIFLYRNIKYIKINAGNQLAFNELIRGLIDRGRLILESHTIGLNSIPKDPQSPPGGRSYFTGPVFPVKNLSLLKRGEDIKDINEYRAIEDSTNPAESRLDRLQFRDKAVDYRHVLSNTKHLKMTSTSGIVKGSFSLLEASIYNWAYYSTNKKYTVLRSLTYGESDVSSVNGFQYWLILLSSILGRQYEHIPCTINIPIIQRSGIESTELRDAVIKSLGDLSDMSTQLDKGLSLLPKLPALNTVESFKLYASDVSNGHAAVYSYINGLENIYSRSLIRSAMQAIYKPIPVLDLSSGGYKVSDWLADNGLTIPDSMEDRKDALQEVLEVFTGYDGSDLNNKNISAVRDILRRLSSYSISIASDSVSPAASTDFNNDQRILNVSYRTSGHIAYRAEVTVTDPEESAT